MTTGTFTDTNLTGFDRLVIEDLINADGTLPRSRLPIGDRDLEDLRQRGLVRVRRNGTGITEVSIPK
jgi:hypothetical protein